MEGRPLQNQSEVSCFGGCVEGFVLAGGRSTRMGQDKVLLQVDGRSLLDLALKKLRSIGVAAPRIAAARTDLSSHAPVVPDLHPGCGPLSGIEAALAATTQPLNLFLPVDLPLLPARFLKWMLWRAEINGALMTVPRIHGRPQPLCAVYHRNLLRPVTESLLGGDYKVMPVITAAAGQSQAVDIFDTERLASIHPELRGFSPLPLYRWFHNCNRPEDMAGIGNALVLSQ
jgi:molybdopterin-guanine dinucleotide biosynthesis protein A